MVNRDTDTVTLSVFKMPAHITITEVYPVNKTESHSVG